MPDHTGPSVVLVFVVIVAFVSFRWAASCALATRCSDVAARRAFDRDMKWRAVGPERMARYFDNDAHGN